MEIKNRFTRHYIQKRFKGVGGIDFKNFYRGSVILDKILKWQPKSKGMQLFGKEGANAPPSPVNESLSRLTIQKLHTET